MDKNLNKPNIVLCGSFRKDDKGLRGLFTKLKKEDLYGALMKMKFNQVSIY